MTLYITSGSKKDLEIIAKLARHLGAAVKTKSEKIPKIDSSTDKIIREHIKKSNKGDFSHFAKGETLQTVFPATSGL